MDILRLGQQGRERPVARVGGDLFDLTPLTQDVDGQWLAAGGLAAARDALQRGTPPLIEDPGHLRIGPPSARPTAVLCIGQNYAGDTRTVTAFSVQCPGAERTQKVAAASQI